MEFVWEKAKAELKTHIPAANYMMWIEPLELKENDEDQVILGCPNGFIKKWVKGYYGDLIASKINQISGKSYHIDLEVNTSGGRHLTEKEKEKDTPAAPRKAKRPRKKTDPQMSLPNVHGQASTGRLLKKEFTFDNFVVGQNNDFAYSAVLSLSTPRNSFNKPLFLTSKSGMGKSHLAQSLGHQYLNTIPNARVYYLTAEDFSNEMVRAYSTKTITTFKDKFRNGYDMLLMEDLHSLSGKERTQTELSMILDYMMEENRKVLFSGCCLPAEIPGLNTQLRSRLAAGLITAMEMPDFKTRVRILRKKCQLYGYFMPAEVLEYLADNLTDDVRQLESGLNSVAMKSSLLGVPVDTRLAESVVNMIAVQRDRLTLDSLKKLVCREYGIPVKDIESRSRKMQFAWPRQVAIFLSRQYTDHSLKMIGQCYNRYHATVIHSINTVERLMKDKEAVRREINLLTKKIEDGQF